MLLDHLEVAVKLEVEETTMQIEVLPIMGSNNYFTVRLAGLYRLTLVDTKDNATMVANTLRAGINRSGRKAKLAERGAKNMLDTRGVID
jgi:hypothetical protein